MELYGLIADLRREHPTPESLKVLDMVTYELQKSNDNLKKAIVSIISQKKSIPENDKKILDELLEKAKRLQVDDLKYVPHKVRYLPKEDLDDATIGIGILLAASSFIIVALSISAVVIAISQIAH